MGSGLEWNDCPAMSSIQFFVSRMEGHTKVLAVEEVTAQVFLLKRHGLSDVRVWVCDVYTLGVADYFAIRQADPDIDCIVTLSGYNQYTTQASEQGIADGVGVFKFGELMGALHKEGEDFVAYSP